ncbi:RES domain protein [Caballeronia cordobensis]|uniref:RES domain protein n=2 Tax=Caballeronia cordobensis TaxID=1353886 RepID=A0A158I6P6_CABCO|nr:RES domain protein [Caballeronia cordobensis]
MAREFGLNLGQLASRRYIHTQRLSRQIHEALDNTGTPAFDGLLYPSRNNFPATCIALFHRAQAKVVVVDDLPLAQHVDWPAFVGQYRIGVAKV